MPTDHTIEAHFEIKANANVFDVRSAIIERMANAYLKGTLGASAFADVKARAAAEQTYDMVKEMLQAIAEMQRS